MHHYCQSYFAGLYKLSNIDRGIVLCGGYLLEEMLRKTALEAVLCAKEGYLAARSPELLSVTMIMAGITSTIAIAN